jgi:formate dehydrogenase maturation protein FdhE
MDGKQTGLMLHTKIYTEDGLQHSVTVTLDLPKDENGKPLLGAITKMTSAWITAMSKLEGVSVSAPSGKSKKASQYPPCPKCGGELVVRTARKGKHAGKRFLSCSNWKKDGTGCNYTDWDYFEKGN